MCSNPSVLKLRHDKLFLKTPLTPWASLFTVACSRPVYMLPGNPVPAADTGLDLQLILQKGELSLVSPRADGELHTVCVWEREHGSLLRSYRLQWTERRWTVLLFYYDFSCNVWILVTVCYNWPFAKLHPWTQTGQSERSVCQYWPRSDNLTAVTVTTLSFRIFVIFRLVL